MVKIFLGFTKILFFFLITIILVELIAPLFSHYFPYQYVPQKILINHFKKSNITEFTLRKNYSGPFVMSRYKIDTLVRTDSNGQRITVGNDNGKEKIYIFGDSFTFGWGVNENETIPSLIQDKVLDYSFINLGFSAGRDLTSYYTWLKKNNNSNNILKSILILWTNDLQDMRRNYCYNVKDIKVKLSSEDCTNIKSSYVVYNGKLFEKNSFLIKNLNFFYVFLKRSYSIALLRIYYDFLFLKNKNINYHDENLSKDDKNKINLILNHFNNNSELLAVVMIDYSKENEFYKYISQISKKNNIKTIKIRNLDTEFRIGEYDPHLNKLGNIFIANSIIKEVF